jgi:hypothetical protein
VLEINEDRAVIEFICQLPIPPWSVANIDELEIVENSNPYSKAAVQPFLPETHIM